MINHCRDLVHSQKADCCKEYAVQGCTLWKNVHHLQRYSKTTHTVVPYVSQTHSTYIVLTAAPAAV